MISAASAPIRADRYTGTAHLSCNENLVSGVATVNYDNLGWIMAGADATRSGLYIGAGVDWENSTQLKYLDKFSAKAPSPYLDPVPN
eukprot:scaffold449968_cov41-Prasinocladus_malaysianus.AAC.1